MSACPQAPAPDTVPLSLRGKPLAGAAKNSFMKKCQADMKAAK